MANIIEFILDIASRLADRRVTSRRHESDCAEKNDPSALIESLAMPQQWIAGTELADAYRSGCGGAA
ncbi:hypothetical protein H0E84_08950 [Luteimonas sp. SJ-92]|uniref:Uncharacterized protein n=1 Tax=Luteimonas salinisoli TaxID=2752307 RepID=A0A853JBA7_9GAMM|nr:hypothetical protein [Luteimonas salinisoli]NZA26513.1 hypothetical protein [Luteimonas salinisoli]